MKLLALLPFLVELIWDYILIVKRNKSDFIRLPHRVLLVITSSLLLMYFEPKLIKTIILACIPYCFFDIILNLLRGKKWYYLSESNGKWWDETFNKLDHWTLLVFRFILFAGLIILYFNIC